MSKETKLPPVRPFHSDFRWDGVELLRYKMDASTPFKDVTRQVLFHDPDIAAELRYFEVAPGGYSTLERHEHAHAVLILRGSGRVLLGEAVHELGTNDLVSIPGMTWHQFRAGSEAPLGFLCMVNMARDKPRLPNAQELEEMRAVPAVAAFLSD
jgi:quercetin dioxygenase-like cupin family protein